MPRPLLITAGEPAGIGPDLVLALAKQTWAHPFVVCADKKLLNERAQQLGQTIELVDYQADVPCTPQLNRLYVEHVSLASPVIAGKLDPSNAHYVLNTLKRATQGCLSDEFSAVVTGPVHKGVINDAGVSFSGHTEFFAEQSNTELVVMMLATEGLRVALATTHLPLSKVSDAITESSLTQVIKILHHDLQSKFAIAKPKIYVCGLNPHAGEDGHLGREELDLIIPTLNKLRQQQGFDLIGPLPADTIFNPNYLAEADAVLAMYHDQGLPVLKYKGFGNSVNITLGLPFIRTSVDHGTALDLAGTGKAQVSSFITALTQAIQLAQHQHG